MDDLRNYYEPVFPVLGWKTPEIHSSGLRNLEYFALHLMEPGSPLTARKRADNAVESAKALLARLEAEEKNQASDGGDDE